MPNDDYRSLFSNRLNYYIRINGKNQTDLINDLALSTSTVSNWCTGLKLPRIEKIQMLADYFQIDISDLLVDKTNSNLNHCLNENTQMIIQKIIDREELWSLFNEAQNAKREDIEVAYNVLLALKRKEKGDI